MTDRYPRGASRRSILQQFGAAAVGISFAGGLSACSSPGERVVNFYNWDTYIGPTTLKDFQAAAARMDAAYQSNRAIFPPADVMAKSEYGAFEGDARARMYEEIFTRISAA